MSRFIEAKRLSYITTIEQRIRTADAHTEGLCVAVNDVYANWLGYHQTGDAESELAAATAHFAGLTEQFVTSRAAGLAQAFDIIAGGMRDPQGNPRTRQYLLDLIAAVE